MYVYLLLGRDDPKYSGANSPPILPLHSKTVFLACLHGIRTLMDYENLNYLPRRLRLTQPNNLSSMWRNNSTFASNATVPYTRNSRIRSVGQSVVKRVQNRLQVQKVLRATKHALARQRRLGGVSRTLFATARKGRQIPAGGGGESKSFFTHKRKNYTKIGKLELSDSTIGRSNGFASQTTQGVQTATNLSELFDATDVDAMFTAAGIASDPSQNSASLFIKDAHATAFITNAESTNVHFSIYDLKSSMDGGTLNTDPATVFLAGYADAVGGAAANGTLIGSSPYTNPRFVQCYKILQETKVILGPGQTHTHNIHYELNRMYNHEKNRINGVASGPVTGISYHCMIVQHGTPVHDATTETIVTIGLSKLDIVLCEQLRFKKDDQGYPTNSLTTTLVTNATGEQMVPDAPADLPDTS